MMKYSNAQKISRGNSDSKRRVEGLIVPCAVRVRESYCSDGLEAWVGKTEAHQGNRPT